MSLLADLGIARSWIGRWRDLAAHRRWALVALAALHAAAVALLMSFEYGPFATSMALLAWVFLNSLWAIALGRPGLAALMSLAMVVVLTLLSQFKFGVLQLTLTFLDFLLIDRDTFSFLFSVVPDLWRSMVTIALVSIPVIWLVWRHDPFRPRRLPAAALMSVSAVAIAGLAIAVPERPWEPFQGVNHISNLARSGAMSISHLMADGWLDADSRPSGGLPPAAPCEVKRPPHIIMVLDESSFDVTAAPGIKVPAGYRDYFKSFDGQRRAFLAEATGGPTWYTEYNVLTGLSSRSFGALRFYLTRIAAGNITRGLPRALKRCGYKTFSLYPTYGDFLDARAFQTALGIDEFIDMAAMGVTEDMQPDSFYFDQALKVMARARAPDTPTFMLVYLTANHFPWTETYRSDLTLGWRAPGNTREVDEYIRRQIITARDYRAFVAQLRQAYPDDSFLIVRFGDHQPALSHRILDPSARPGELARRLMVHDPRYYATYYAIDTINFEPADTSSALAMLDAAYLPIAVQDAAGLPLDPSFAAQKKMLLRCNGLFYACNGGQEARRLNRLLKDAGLIKNL
jgi:phosphoglycerol transferase MdoB-like AlkP superfamily enzyme